MTYVHCCNIHNLRLCLFLSFSLSFVCFLSVVLTANKQNCPNSTSQCVFVMETVCSLSDTKEIQHPTTNVRRKTLALPQPCSSTFIALTGHAVTHVKRQHSSALKESWVMNEAHFCCIASLKTFARSMTQSRPYALYSVSSSQHTAALYGGIPGITNENRQLWDTAVFWRQGIGRYDFMARFVLKCCLLLHERWRITSWSLYFINKLPLVVVYITYRVAGSTNHELIITCLFMQLSPATHTHYVYRVIHDLWTLLQEVIS